MSSDEYDHSTHTILDLDRDDACSRTITSHGSGKELYRVEVKPGTSKTLLNFYKDGSSEPFATYTHRDIVPDKILFEDEKATSLSHWLKHSKLSA
jgi:hypothetical protein